MGKEREDLKPFTNFELIELFKDAWEPKTKTVKALKDEIIRRLLGGEKI